MSNVKHCHNWKAAEPINNEGVKTVCNVRRPVAVISQTPQEISCGVCALRVLREGQANGLSEDDVMRWTWAALKAPEPPR